MGPWHWGAVLGLVALVVGATSHHVTENQQQQSGAWSRAIASSMVVYRSALECYGRHTPFFVGAPNDSDLAAAGCLASNFKRPLSEDGVGVKGVLSMNAGAVYYDGPQKGVTSDLLKITQRSPFVGTKTPANKLRSLVDNTDTTMDVPPGVPAGVTVYVFSRS